MSQGTGLSPLARSLVNSEGKGGRLQVKKHWPAVGARELFPLPLFAAPSSSPGGSRSSRKRWGRIKHRYDDLNEAVNALNWMAGKGPARESLPSPMQHEVLLRMEGLAACQQPKEAVPTPEGLKALLRGGTPYDAKPTSETLASYQAELVSLPDDITKCPELSQVLHEHDRRFLEQTSELMLRPAEDLAEVEPIEPYWDPKLKFNRKEYHRLVRRLDGIGYFHYTTRPACSVGIFFVWKSSRTKLRLITDARRANQLFKAPPGVQLLSSEGFGKIELDVSAEVLGDPEAFSALEIFVGLSDIKDCYHRMKVPRWISRYFAWEAVPAKVLKMTGQELDGKVLGPLDPVYPCAGCLCQGWSWSLFFAQRANEQLCLSSRLLREASLVNDKSEPVVLKVGHVGGRLSEDSHVKQFFYVYVDNLGVIGHNKSKVESALGELQGIFNGLGLELHKSEVGSQGVEALGCVLDGSAKQSRLKPTRLWKVRQGILGLLRRGRCTGRALEVILGHCTFCALMCRPALSIFNSAYAFVRCGYMEVRPLWKTVVEELQCFRGILLLLCQEWARPWNTLVSSSDASLSGYGVCQAWWPRSEVERCGRISERSRFKRVGPHSARESALLKAGLGRQLKGGAALEALEQEGWRIEDSFPEIPAAGLRRELWCPKMWGAWRYREGILVLEARAALKGLKRVLLTKYGHSMRQLLLCDNLPCVLSFERGRSHNYAVLKILREYAAYCLARNVSVTMRWIPSELNIADEPSRLHDEEDSKLLIDLITEEWGSHGTKAYSNLGGSEPDWDSKCRDVWAPARAHRDCHTPADDAGESGQVSATTLGSSLSPCKKNAAIQGEKAGVAQDGFAAGGDREEVQTPQSSERSQRIRQHLIRAQGREKRRQRACGPDKSPPSTSENRGCRNEWFHGSGNGRGDKAGPSTLQEKTSRTEPVRGARAASLHDGQGDRRCSCEAFQPGLSGWRGQPLWRLHHRSPFGQGPRVWSAGIAQDPSRVEKLERVETAVPISLEACLSLGGLVCDELADGGERTSADGNLQPPPGLDLPPSQRAPEAPEDGAGAAYEWDHRLLVSDYKPFRDRRHLEDGHQRRLRDAGLELAAVHQPDPRGSQSWQADGPGVGFRLRRIPLRLSELLPGPSHPAGALPSTPLRAEHRQGRRAQKPRRGPKARRMGEQKEHGSLREGGEVGSNLEVLDLRSPAHVRHDRAIHRGNHARPKLSGHHHAWLSAKGAYVADFFSGHGGVARAVRKLGFSTREWEIEHGTGSDLTRKPVLLKIRDDIFRGSVIAAMLAPPCTSFTRARDRTSIIRTSEQPWGLDGLDPVDAQKVHVGNRCMRSALRIIFWLERMKVPWILEHPFSSKAWYLPRLRYLRRQPHIRAVATDFCQFNVPWQKLCSRIDEQDLARCHKLCTGSSGYCTTGRRHVQLTGSSNKGIPLTRIAQPYPGRLCHALGYALTSHARVVQPWF